MYRKCSKSNQNRTKMKRRLNLSVLLVFVLMIKLTQAQTGAITGKVTTSDGKAVEFVNVVLKGTQSGTGTDKNGFFEIKNIPPGKYTVSASLVGLNTLEQQVEVKPNEVANIDFMFKESAHQLTEININESRTSKFYHDSTFIVAKLPLRDIENPQVYNSVSKELLTEQVATSFNDGIKNATGVTRLWESTGRGGDGAEYYSMRGFAVQPTMVNGMPSVNNSGLDPANIETIDVIKGPSGTLFGSSLISYGGLINITTKKPYETLGGEIGFVTGSNGLNRFTADVNVPLNEKSFARINTAYHTENSFQDAGFNKSLFIAPSFTFKSSEKLTFLINTEFLSRKSANAPMIFLNRYAPLTFNSIHLFEANYKNSFTANDLSISNPAFGLQAQALYKISKSWTSQTVLSRSNTKSSGYYQYLWDFSDGDSFGRYISKRNGETNTTNIQQNFIGDLNIGSVRNRVVIGIDYFKMNILNSSPGWVLNGIVSLSTADDTGDLTQAGVDELLVNTFEGNSNAESEVTSAYISDVVNITPNLSAMASLRVDQFKGKTAYWIEEEVKSQTALSPKFGVVYQPVLNMVSIFANYMNGFVNVAPVEVSDVDGSNSRLKTFDPENANQFEFGVKTNIYRNKISATASYYNIVVKNRVMSDPENVNNSIQGGEVESKGYEVSIIANPFDGLNLIAGYSDNHCEVTKDNPGDGYLGLRPEEAGPATLINFWASYTFKNRLLKGLGFGFGGNHAAEHMTLNRANTGTFTLPSYTVLSASVSYSGSNYNLILKSNNVTDQKYYSGWSTVTPQNPRSLVLSLNYKF